MNTISDTAVRPPWAEDAILLSHPFSHSEGFCWRIVLPSGLSFRGDTNEQPYVSRIVLLENGQPIGEPHMSHAAIAANGCGRYAAWHDTLYFSSSDNSDPNVNGRRYAITLAPFDTAPVYQTRVLALGSCHVHMPIEDLHGRRLAKSVMRETAIRTNSHHFAEHLQLIEYCRGNLQIPREIRQHIFGKPDFDPQSDNGAMVDTADIAMLEVCSQFELMFEQWHVNRNIIADTIIRPAHEWGEAAGKAAINWYWNGFLKTDEEARKALAAKLLEFMPREGAQAEMDRILVREAHAVKLDAATMQRRLKECQESFSAPIAVVTHNLRYMPDGRPLIWPPEFLRTVNDVCRVLDVPIINPCRLVMRYGVASGMTEDMGHYRPDFIPIVADEFLSFIRHIEQRKGPNQSGATLPIPLASY